MTREEAKRRAELYSALAEGKTIQVQNPNGGEWFDVKIDTLRSISEELSYRIKPEPKYRPFNSLQEAWDEMAKHSPFAWVHYKDPDIASDNRRVILNISEDDGNLSFVVMGLINSYFIGFDEMFDKYEFTDGEPFGIKE